MAKFIEGKKMKKMLNKPEIHDKIWGNEIWIVNNEKYCGKILELREGYRSSMHYHKEKDETFYILYGRVLIEAYDGMAVLERGDSIRILPETLHRFTGLKNSLILEISTYHKESDSYRIEDKKSEKVPEDEFNLIKSIYD
ncbi:MAG: cupin domain-containing protein [Candidatus Aenigmatarchaeota archaeon]